MKLWTAKEAVCDKRDLLPAVVSPEVEVFINSVGIFNLRC